MFKPWRDERAKDCPSEESTLIEDIPGVWGGNGTNTIQFELIIKSSPNCDCGDMDEVKFCFEFRSTVGNRASRWWLNPIDCTPEKFPAFKYDLRTGDAEKKD